VRLGSPGASGEVRVQVIKRPRIRLCSRAPRNARTEPKSSLRVVEAIRVFGGQLRRVYFICLITMDVRHVLTVLQTSVRGAVLIRDVPNACANGTPGIHG
jgi:hypothetical protein